MKKKLLLLGIVFSFVMIFSNIIPVKAEITYDDSMAVVLEDQKVVVRGTSSTDEGNYQYLAQTMSFIDNVPTENMYVVYPDLSAATTDGVNQGDTTTINYKGQDYTVKVHISSQFDGPGGLDSIIKDNTTIFFKPGEYKVSDGNANYARIYKANLSLIGLEDTLNAPTVSFDLGYQTVSGVNYNTRNLIQKNFYVANVIFDAKSRPMKSNSNPASSGEYYIHLASGQDDVMFDNVTIQNVNNTSFSSNKNVAINVLNAQRVLFKKMQLPNLV